MSLTNRLFIYGPFVLFLVLVSVVSVRWWVEAAAFSARLDAMNGRKIAPGVTFHFAQKRVSGFPFRLDAIFKGIQVQIDTPHGPSAWHAGDFALHRLTYGTKRTLFEAAGRQSLSWTSENGQHHELSFEAGSMRASASDDDIGLTRFDLDVIGVGTPLFTASQVQVHVRNDPQIDALDIALSVDNVHLLSAIRSTLGDRIKLMRAGATMVPGKVFEALRAGKREWPEALRAFAAGRGSAHVDDFAIAFSGFTADGHGVFGLDAALRPTGLFNFHVAETGDATAQTQSHSGASRITTILLKQGRAAAKDNNRSFSIAFACSNGMTYLGNEIIGAVETVL